MLSLERKQELIAFCQAAIRCKSLSGQEGEIAALLSAMMKKKNFNSVSVDRYGNVVGQIILGKGGQKLLMEGHMDHVDVSDPSKWHFDPYGAEIADDKIYGRGTSDMKGNLCAMLLAAAYVREDKGSELNGEVLVAGSVHEECFEGVASEEIGKNWKPDKVIIGEASNLTVKRGQRGRAEVVAETFGKTAHSSTPGVGVNAVKKMARLIDTLDQTFQPATHPVLGEGILEVTDIISSPYPGASVIPEHCRATFDRRLLVGRPSAPSWLRCKAFWSTFRRRTTILRLTYRWQGERKPVTQGRVSAPNASPPAGSLRRSTPLCKRCCPGCAPSGKIPICRIITFAPTAPITRVRRGFPPLDTAVPLRPLLMWWMNI